MYFYYYHYWRCCAQNNIFILSGERRPNRPNLITPPCFLIDYILATTAEGGIDVMNPLRRQQGSAHTYVQCAVHTVVILVID